jgi:hypothetical protein
MGDKETIVKNYVNAYNNFDVNGMIADRISQLYSRMYLTAR